LWVVLSVELDYLLLKDLQKARDPQKVAFFVALGSALSTQDRRAYLTLDRPIGQDIAEDWHDYGRHIILTLFSVTAAYRSHIIFVAVQRSLLKWRGQRVWRHSRRIVVAYTVDVCPRPPSSSKSMAKWFVRVLQGVVRHLATLVIDGGTEHGDAVATNELPAAAMAAIRNGINASPPTIREQLVTTLPWPRMKELLEGPCEVVAARAWHTMQNLCHTSDGACFQAQMLNWAGPQLLPVAISVVEGVCLTLQLQGRCPDDTQASVGPICVLWRLAVCRGGRCLKAAMAGVQGCRHMPEAHRSSGNGLEIHPPLCWSSHREYVDHHVDQTLWATQWTFAEHC
jgi:hypothetical protein